MYNNTKEPLNSKSYQLQMELIMHRDISRLGITKIVATPV